MIKTYTLLVASLIASTALVSPALASSKGLVYGPHKFGGEIKLQSEHHSNIGAAPSSSGIDFDDDIDGDDMRDEFGDDAVDSVLEDLDIDEEDLVEMANDGDQDNDGIDDALDSNLPSSRSDSAFRHVISGQLKHAYEFTDAITLKSAFKAAANNNSNRDDLDKVNWAFTTGPVFKLVHNIDLQPSVTFMSVDKDAGRATDTWVGSLAAEWKASKQWAFGAQYNYQNRDIVAANGTDANVDSLKLMAKYKPTKQDEFKFGFAPTIEDASRASKNKNKYSFDVGYQHDFAHDIQVGAGIKYAYTDNVNLTRQDNDTVYDLGVQKSFDSGVFVGTGLAYKARSSNIAIKSNHDATVLVNTGWKF